MIIRKENTPIHGEDSTYTYPEDGNLAERKKWKIEKEEGRKSAEIEEYCENEGPRKEWYD